MRDWKLSFHSRSYWVHHQMDLFASAQAIKAAGYDALEIAMPHLKQLEIGSMSAGDRATFRRRFADLGIEIGSISGHSTICHEDAAIRRPEVAFFKSALDFAADVGAGVVATHALYRRQGPPGFLTRDPGETYKAFRERVYPEPTSDRRGFLVEILSDLARHAEARGVVVGLEDLDPSPAQLWETLVREIDSPGLRLNLQVHHGTTPARALRERRDIVAHFHMKPPTEGAGYEGWSLGEYIDFVNALEEVHFPRDYFTIEEHSELDPHVTAPRLEPYFRRLLA